MDISAISRLVTRLTQNPAPLSADETKQMLKSIPNLNHGVDEVVQERKAKSVAILEKTMAKVLAAKLKDMDTLKFNQLFDNAQAGLVDMPPAEGSNDPASALRAMYTLTDSVTALEASNSALQEILAPKDEVPASATVDGNTPSKTSSEVKKLKDKLAEFEAWNTTILLILEFRHPDDARFKAVNVDAMVTPMAESAQELFAKSFLRDDDETSSMELVEETELKEKIAKAEVWKKTMLLKLESDNLNDENFKIKTVDAIVTKLARVTKEVTAKYGANYRFALPISVPGAEHYNRNRELIFKCVEHPNCPSTQLLP